MFYRLCEGYGLRGWKGNSCVLFKRPLNLSLYLKKEQMPILLLCDGVTEFSRDDLSEEETKILDHFLEKGYIQELSEPKELDTYQQFVSYDNPKFDSCFWSITGRCNYRCRHCYMDAPSGQLGEITHEQAMDIIDQMAACGVLRVDITGGEPFVRKDFWEIVDRLISYDIAIGQIYTNGWMLTDEILDKLEERNLKPHISISFDGIGWHDWMRGVVGAEEAALKAIKLCIQRGFMVTAEMVVFKGNAGTIRSTINMLADLGVSSLKLSQVVNTPLWLSNCEGQQYDSDEFAEDAIAYIPHFFEDGARMDLQFGGVVNLFKGSTKYLSFAERYHGKEECLNGYLCNSARSDCYITPEGRLLPCMPMTFWDGQDAFPLIQDIGFKKGITDSYYSEFITMKVRDLFEENTECGNCSNRYSCGGGCRAYALVEEESLYGCDRTMCRLWKNGVIARVHEAADQAIREYEKKRESK